jgi:hypothetical protein
MAKRKSKKAAKEAKGSDVLPAAGTTGGGVSPNSFESARGPIVSKASTLAEAHGIEDAEEPEEDES